VLLLDEPLSNLDARLRSEMREEIRRIHEETGLTSIYVTHDQKEALSLADRMAVMHQGRVIQVGLPRELYLRPYNPFVASFLGEANMLPGRVLQRSGERAVVETDLGTIEGIATHDAVTEGQAVLCCIRPESILLDPLGTTQVNQFRATIARDLFFGEVRHLYLQSRGTTLLCYSLSGTGAELRTGSESGFAIEAQRVNVLPAGPEQGGSGGA
jgi:ABC-type Fe3+/spermidine/putrescine transport system ATPase subunit